jgi:hypothetical protein
MFSIHLGGFMNDIEQKPLSNEEVLKFINDTFNTNYTSSKSLDLLQALSELWDSGLPINNTVKQLKKQIKYAKNPLEVRQLNIQLNNLYKYRKKTKSKI